MNTANFWSDVTTSFSILIVWLAPPFIWALVVVVAPKFFSDVLLKAVEHRHNVRLEEIKAELSRENDAKIAALKAGIESHYSTLKSSIDLVSANQSEVRSRQLKAIEKMWDVLLKMSAAFGGLIILDTILLASELNEYFSGKRNKPSDYIQEAVKPFLAEDSVLKKWNAAGAEEAERERPFVGEEIWKFFYVLRAVYGRFAMLIKASVKQKKYLNWKEDTHTLRILQTAVPTDVIDTAKKMDLQGLQMILLHLTQSFLKEAEHVLSGTRSAANAIPNLQTILMAERDKLEAGIRTKPE